MSLHSIARRLLVAAAAVTLTAPAARVDAQAITYSFAGTLPAFLGAQAFDLQLQSTVSGVMDLSSLLGAPAGVSVFANQALSANATIGGFGTIPLDSFLGAGSQYFVGSINGLAGMGLPFTNGVGFLGLGTNGLVLGLFQPTTTYYDLGSSFGPATGTAYAYIGQPGGASLLSASYGPMGFDPNDIIALRKTSFSATVTSTPEPASIALMATGLLGLAGVVARRRKQQA